MIILQAVNFFNGLIVIILGSAILYSGLKDVFTDYNRWVVGIGCILFGLIAEYGVYRTWKQQQR